MQYVAPLLLLCFAGVCYGGSDADYWKHKGIDNANKDLDKFDAILAGLSGEGQHHPQLTVQLKVLQAQIDEAGKNNAKIVPVITRIIGSINWMLTNPGFFKKMSLKALIYFVDGKRDNKSYYLLDGAQLWAEKRLAIIAKRINPEPVVTDLTTDLKAVQTQTILLRDQLDAMAQIFVAGLKKIHSMTGDISGNLKELQKTAQEMKKVSEEKDSFLKNTTDLRKRAADLAKKYQ